MNSTQQSKRRGRKPRGGISNLDDILAYPTSTPSVQSVQPVFIPPAAQTLAPFTTPTDEVHMHHIDYPWHEDSATENIITPQEFQIRHLNHQPNKASDADKELQDDEVDELDLFPNDDFIDYETVFKTQTSASQNRTLHMSARDRESAEVYRPQNEISTEQQQTNVPEHMRIIALPVSSTPAVVHHQTMSTTSLEHAVPEFFHPFRIHFQPPVHNHCMEDPISWPSKSPFACWWCKHTFECYPKVTPVSIRGTNVEVIGNFCSWNCSKSWTLQNLKRLDYFNTFYHTLFSESSNEVVPAPSYLSIDTFGGPFAIEQYRAGLNNPERQIRFETFSNVHIVVSKMFIKAS
jgi:hypothetical protein